MNSIWKQALRAALPHYAGLIPYGIVTGITISLLGISPFETALMSLIMLSGAAQIAAVQLFEEAAPMAIIILAIIAINARFMVYSASIAPHWQDMGRWKYVLPLFMTDQSYVQSLIAYERNPDFSNAQKRLYYFIIAVSIAIIWTLSCFMGAYFGQLDMSHLRLEFIVPLCFLVLLKSRLIALPHIIAALVAGVTALVLSDLPLRAGLLPAIIFGIAAGIMIQYWSRRFDKV